MLNDQILRQFPEVLPYIAEGDEDLPYVMVRHIVQWLLIAATPGFDPAVIQRVKDFHHWCLTQPQGTSAEDDIPTIEMVGFVEKLLEHDALLPLVPHVLEKEDLLRNHEYWINWVGSDRYQAAVQAFDHR